ncbi:MAG: MarR family transcriptional regulator [Arachnia sp.]
MDFDEANRINQSIRGIVIRHRALADRLLGTLGLYAGQEVLLLELGEKGPRSQAQLAVASGCEPPTITHSVRKLEAAALVERWPSPDDGRVTMVGLSDHGREVLVQLKAVWCELADQTVAGLTGTSVELLDEVVADLGSSLASALSERPA